MMDSIGVIYCPNPLRPASERQVRRLLVTSCDTVDSLVLRLGLSDTPLMATLNGMPVPRGRWRRTRVRAADVLVLQQLARGAETVAGSVVEAIGATGKAAAVISAVVVVAYNMAVAMVLSMLANALAGNKSNRQTDDSSPTAYSIEGGSNSMRPYEPLPLVLGEHRMFPDYASRPFAEFVEDTTTTHLVINNTPGFEPRTPPEWAYTESGPPYAPIVTPAPPWTLIGSENVEFGVGAQYYGDNAPRTYNRPVGIPSGNITQPHTFVVRHTPGNSANDAITTYEDWLSLQPSPFEGSGGGGGD